MSNYGGIPAPHTDKNLTQLQCYCFNGHKEWLGIEMKGKWNNWVTQIVLMPGVASQCKRNFSVPLNGHEFPKFLLELGKAGMKPHCGFLGWNDLSWKFLRYSLGISELIGQVFCFLTEFQVII